MIEHPVSEAGAGAELASHSFPALAWRGDSRFSVTCVTRPAASGPPTTRAPTTWPRPGRPPSLSPRDPYLWPLWPPPSTPPLSTVPPIGLGVVSAGSSRR